MPSEIPNAPCPLQCGGAQKEAAFTACCPWQRACALRTECPQRMHGRCIAMRVHVSSDRNTRPQRWAHRRALHQMAPLPTAPYSGAVHSRPPTATRHLRCGGVLKGTPQLHSRAERQCVPRTTALCRTHVTHRRHRHMAHPFNIFPCARHPGHCHLQSRIIHTAAPITRCRK